CAARDASRTGAASVPRRAGRTARRHGIDRRRDGGDAREDGVRTARVPRRICRARRRGRARDRWTAGARLPRGAGAARGRVRRRAPRRATTLDEAITLASSHADGAKVLVVSPMFPLPLEDRERIAPALRALAEAGNTT